MFNLFKLFGAKKVGLALGSGGAKGIAHIAVLEYLSSMGIPIHMLAGSSIGSVISALYACGSLTRFRNDLLAMKKSDMISLFDPVFPKSGFIEGDRFIEFLSRYVPTTARLEDLSIPVNIVATEFFTGKTVVFDSGPVLDAVRASVSIPGVLIPVRRGQSLLVDGGVTNPLPIDVVEHMGADLTIAVNLHPTVVKTKFELLRNNPVNGAGGTETGKMNFKQAAPDNEPDAELSSDGEKDRGIMRYFDKWFRTRESEKTEEKFPTIFEVIGQSIDIMEYMITEMTLQRHRPTVLIEPNLIEMKTLDFLQARSALDEGTRACERQGKALLRKIKRRV
ncbi:MAG TPA: patatin-like phospholipase family protein [Spirochaetota bacterium]|nr:patatin-like phospholipase family protein [Spirochaetota bacterium]